MEIVTQMVMDMLSRGEVALTLSHGAAERLETNAVRALSRIRSILADEGRDDPECFRRIEAIVCELESVGIDCGTRHDFG